MNTLRKGGTNSIYKIIGASNHAIDGDREINDYYATSPKAVLDLLELESFNKNIYECAVGEGHIAKTLEDKGYNVIGSDIINRGYKDTIIRDYLTYNPTKKINMDIITNPPYKYAREFVIKSNEILEKGNRIAMFLKVTFLEGQARKEMFKKYPPKYVYVFSKRALSAKNGEFIEKYKNKNDVIKERVRSSAVAYAWFIWEIGSTSETIVRWI